jgi:predicted tellurium resistance membrane protein TerC
MTYTEIVIFAALISAFVLPFIYFLLYLLLRNIYRFAVCVSAACLLSFIGGKVFRMEGLKINPGFSIENLAIGSCGSWSDAVITAFLVFSFCFSMRMYREHEREL